MRSGVLRAERVLSDHFLSDGWLKRIEERTWLNRIRRATRQLHEGACRRIRSWVRIGVCSFCGSV